VAKIFSMQDKGWVRRGEKGASRGVPIIQRKGDRFPTTSGGVFGMMKKGSEPAGGWNREEKSASTRPPVCGKVIILNRGKAFDGREGRQEKGAKRFPEGCSCLLD